MYDNRWLIHNHERTAEGESVTVDDVLGAYRTDSARFARSWQAELAARQAEQEERDYRVPRRTALQIRRETRDGAIRLLVEDDCPIERIADLFGISASRVRTIARTAR